MSTRWLRRFIPGFGGFFETGAIDFLYLLSLAPNIPGRAQKSSGLTEKGAQK
jgi:hypothetical protein